MHMDLDQRFISLDQRTIAHGADVGQDLGDRLVGLLDQKLDVEAPLNRWQFALALAQRVVDYFFDHVAQVLVAVLRG